MLFRAIAGVALAAITTSCGVERNQSSAETSAAGAAAEAGARDAADPAGDAIAGSPDQSAAVQPPGANVVTADGWGPLRIGMTRAEIVAAAGEDANPQAVGGAEPGHCDQFRPSRAPDGVLVMVENGVLTRISISRNSDIRTPEGISVGDAASRVLEAYGARALVTPHKYWPSPAKYVTVWRDSVPSSERRGIRFEVDADDEVVHVHAGSRSIEYVEGCS